jgi:hypothetical protein
LAGIAWIDDPEAGFAEARSKRKMVLLDFSDAPS